MSIVLALKLALVPSLIAGVTLAGRRWGPNVAGWLSAFPVVSAPILFFIAMEQGASFAATASVATLSGVLANVAFGVSYAWAALRYAWKESAALGFASYFAAVAALSRWAPSLTVSCIAVVIALVASPRLYPNPPAAPESAVSVPRGDIWWRMATGAALVLFVTQFSAQLGPRWTGLFAMFPVIASVLAVFSHRHLGAGFAIKLMRSMAMGYYGFACFCVVLALALPRMTIGLAFLASLGTALLVHGGSRLYLRAQSGPSPVAPRIR